jgi:phosphonatase-like hydrolase
MPLLGRLLQFYPEGGQVNSPELVILDVAGTTVEDRGQVPGAFTDALAEYGIEVTREQVRGVRGASKRQALLHFIPAGPGQMCLAEKVYASFRQHLARRYSSGGVQPIPGAPQAIRLLRARGVRVALTTGFDRETTELLLGALAWADGMVDAVVCGDDVTQGRPAPYLIFHAMEATGVGDVHRVANVGDTLLDLQAAYNAGVRWNIGVLTGAHDRAILERAPHTHLIPSVAELTSLWTVA